MTTYKVLYWQEIPSQIRAEDDDGNEVSLELSAKFLEHIDATAQKRGFTNADDYLAQWQWSDQQQREGSAQEVAESVKAEFEAKGP